MHHTYYTSGTCSRQIDFDIDEQGRVSGISFVGGCNGNLKGICALAQGQQAAQLISTLKGIRCGNKSTSCPDQLAQALAEALEAKP